MWRELVLNPHRWQLRDAGGRLEVRGYDLEAERAAAILSGQLAPEQAVFEVIDEQLRRGAPLADLLEACDKHPTHQMAWPEAGRVQLVRWAAELKIADDDLDYRHVIVDRELPVQAVGLLLELHDLRTEALLACNPVVDRRIRARLLADEAVRYEVTGAILAGWVRGEVPDDVWMALAKDDRVSIRIFAASETRHAAAACRLLAQDADEQVRRRLANAANVPAAVRRRLARDQSGWVREALAGSVALEPEVELLLARDGERGVRDTLAGNRYLGPEAARVMTKDPDRLVRTRLARTSEHSLALRLLSQDEDQAVAELARARIDHLRQKWEQSRAELNLEGPNPYLEEAALELL